MSAETFQSAYTRKSARWAVPLEIEICKGSAIEGCTVRDVSLKGIAFEGSDNPKYHAGSKIQIRPKLPNSLEEIRKKLQSDELVKIDIPIDGHIIRKFTLLRNRKRARYAVAFNDEHRWIQKIAQHIDPRPISPWLNPNLREKIAQLVSNYESRIPQLSRRDVDIWLDQFQKEVQPAMLNLLEVICDNYFFNNQKCGELARTLYAKILSLSRSSNYHQIRILTIGRESRGAGNTIYLMRAVNNLPVKIFPDTTDSLLEDLGQENVKVVAFVDDFFGTGDTVIKTLPSRLSKLPAAAIKDVTLVACALVGFRSAKENIETHFAKNNPGLQLKVEAAILLEDTEDRIFTFKAKEMLEPDRPLTSRDFGKKFFGSKQEAEKVCRECFAHPLYFCDGAEKPLGYGNLASPVVFHYNTPNNALPIFWYNEKLWKSIFPRRSFRDYGSWDPPRHIFPKLVEAQAKEISKEICKEQKDLAYLIVGGPGSGKFLLSSEVARHVRPSKNVFWFEFTEHSTADCLRNQLEEYLDQTMPGKHISDKLKRMLDPDEKDEFLISKANELSALIVFHHFDRQLEKLRILGPWEIQRKELRVLVRKIATQCKRETAIIFTTDTEEKFHEIIDHTDPDLAPKPITPKLDLASFYTAKFGDEGHHIDNIENILSANTNLSLFGQGLAILLYKGSWQEASDLHNVTDEVLLDRLFHSLGKNEQKTILCAAAIRHHRTEGVLAKIHTIAFGKPVDIGSISESLKDLSERWSPIIFRDKETGELKMSDKLRAYLYKTEILKLHDLHLWHKAIAEVYSELEAPDWAKKIEYTAVFIDHYLEAEREDYIYIAAEKLRQARRFFAKYGKLQHYSFLVSSLTAAIEENYIKNPQNRNHLYKNYLELGLELMRVYRQYSEIEKMEQLYAKIKCQEWGNENILPRSGFEYFESVSKAAKGKYFEADILCGSALRLLNDYENHLGDRNRKLLQKQKPELFRNKIRFLLRNTQIDMSLSDYSASWNHLYDTIRLLKELQEIQAKAEQLHSLPVASRHVSTLFYLDGDSINALKWANISYSLNTELKDPEGQAVSLIKISLAWGLLGEKERAITSAKNAKTILKNSVPVQTWWLLAVEQALCLAHLRKLRNQWGLHHPKPKQIVSRLKEIFDTIENMKELLGSVEAPCFAPWNVEIFILEAEAHIWANKLKKAEQSWERAWAEEAKRENKSPAGCHGTAYHAISLLASLGSLIRKKKKVFDWLPQTVLGTKKPKNWRDYSILCFMEAVKILTSSQLFNSQEWFLRQIIEIAEEAPPSKFLDAAMLWATHRSALRGVLQCGDKNNYTNTFLDPEKKHPFYGLSSCLEKASKLSRLLPEARFANDDANTFFELDDMRKKVCEYLEEMISTSSD